MMRGRMIHLHSTRAKKWRTRVSWILVALGVLGILYSQTKYGLGNTDQLSSVLSYFVTILGSLGLLPTLQKTDPSSDQWLNSLRENVHEFLDSQKQWADIDTRDLIPMTIWDGILGATRLAPGAGEHAWSVTHCAGQLSLFHLAETRSRTFLSAESGMGKTLLALLLANGLNAKANARIPLYLPLASWSPCEEDFADWFDRQVSGMYPCLQQLAWHSAKSPRRQSVRRGPHYEQDNLLRRLKASDSVMLILDGFDEIRDTAQDQALAAINAIEGIPLFILSQPLHVPLKLADVRVLELQRPTRTAAWHYLTDRTSSLDAATEQPHWVNLLHALDTHALPELTGLMRSPLYLDLLLTGAIRAKLPRPELPQDLYAEVLLHGGEAGRRLLLETFMDQRLRSQIDSPRRRARVLGQVQYLAHEMNRTLPAATGLLSRFDRLPTTTAPAHALAWWRLYTRVPPAVFGIGATLVAVPAYRLCLHMPDGLTRGFAVGIVTGVILGAGRGVRTCYAAPVALIGVCAVILCLGWRLRGINIAVTDAAEIGPPVALVFLLRDFLVDSAARCLLAVVSIGASAGCGVAAVAAVGLPHDAQRGFLGVMSAVVAGVLVATVSARILTTPKEHLLPSTADFRWTSDRGPKRPHFAAALTAACLVGVGGGVIGGAFGTPGHGVRVALAFAVTAGIPIGIVAGLIQWWNQPPPKPTAGFFLLYRRDQALALISVVLVGSFSTLGLAFLGGFLRFLVRPIEASSDYWPKPVDGVLFGATLGIIVAAFNTAWLSYAWCCVYFALRRRMPWRIVNFFDLLHECDILHQRGPHLVFRIPHLQQHLAAQHHP
ncbi:hypothetical protein ACFWCA_51100 [Streptomyces phaeochromogenes]|uniref:hypothetical protein n=1 Tax=Streptomyces phaeochromogenes TaxID=1923 RepID=UPI0036882603